MVLSALVRAKHAFLFTSVVALTFLLPSSARATQTTVDFADTIDTVMGTTTGRASIPTIPGIGRLCGLHSVPLPNGSTLALEGCIAKIEAPKDKSFSSGNQVYLASESSTTSSDAILVIGDGSLVTVIFLSDFTASGQETGFPLTCAQLKALADVDVCNPVSEAGSIHITWGTGSNMVTDTVTFHSDAEGVTPEPTSLVLLGSGLLAIAGFLRKRL